MKRNDLLGYYQDIFLENDNSNNYDKLLKTLEFQEKLQKELFDCIKLMLNETDDNVNLIVQAIVNKLLLPREIGVL